MLNFINPLAFPSFYFIFLFFGLQLLLRKGGLKREKNLELFSDQLLRNDSSFHPDAATIEVERAFNNQAGTAGLYSTIIFLAEEEKPEIAKMLACVIPANESFKSKTVTVKLRHHGGRSKKRTKLLSVKEKNPSVVQTRNSNDVISATSSSSSSATSPENEVSSIAAKNGINRKIEILTLSDAHVICFKDTPTIFLIDALSWSKLVL